ncbi:hypothetical protein CALCODRAFT_553183 [Calocera cornea HHB12733]|uniref:F-box domain-containing protein n=1 Tax=Calocera cornea HHB12733 TaxID=1353952 RepID=A0A165J1C2_9BASI|nr:hypothetical protein CALCODRAFT_553183 [Calocera cornea HHB12733]
MRELDVWNNWSCHATPLQPKDLFGRLYNLRSLEGFGLHSTYPVDMDDTDIDVLVQACPQLTRLIFSLDINAYRIVSRLSRLSRRSILTLVQAYPSLQALALSVDHALPYNEEGYVNLSGLTCPNVRVWDSVESNLADPLESFTFMRRYFPNIRAFSGCVTVEDARLIKDLLGTTERDLEEHNPDYVMDDEWRIFHMVMITADDGR